MESVPPSSEQNTATLYEWAREHERAGRLAEAGAIYLRIVEREPRHGNALFRLGLAAFADGRLAVAEEFLRRAVATAPTVAAHHSALGRTLQKRGLGEAANAAHAIAVRLAPQDAEVRYRLGEAQWRGGELGAAEATLRVAIRLDPRPEAAHRVLAKVLGEQGRFDEALGVLRQHLAAEPDAWRAHDMLLFSLLFDPASTRASLHAEHTAWNEWHAAPLRKFIQPHRNERSPGRRLKIGYVSADLRRHAVAHFLLPLFAHHDRTKVEIFAYAAVRSPDAVTDRFKPLVDGWRDVAGWSDEKLAECIRGDGIDILVDLSLHSEDHRLFVFARKPAPVQVTFAGYPASTGLDTIDYRLTDRFLDPPEWGDTGDAEKSIRLPDSFWCFDPIVEEPAVGPLPASSAGAVTFGCLNKSAKINAATVALWARVLRALPNTRMILLADPGWARPAIRALFAHAGVDLARIEFLDRRGLRDYRRMHHRIDIALDPIPYGGHATLVDGLWMGVPTIVLPGETAVSRAGLSLLTNVGLTDWIASSPEDFVRLAVEHSRDLGRLAALRAELRPRLKASPLMDAPRFARHVEAAYCAMWRTWCAGAAAPTP